MARTGETRIRSAREDRPSTNEEGPHALEVDNDVPPAAHALQGSSCSDRHHASRWQDCNRQPKGILSVPLRERPEFAHRAEQRIEVEEVVKPVPVQLELAAIDSHHYRVEHRDQRARELIRASQLDPQRLGDSVGPRTSEPTRLNQRSQGASEFGEVISVGFHAERNAVPDGSRGQRDSATLSASPACPGDSSAGS
jgi:hypothetical protein